MAGTLTIDQLKASSGVLATQNGMTGIAKAWVKFTGSTPPVINGSFNISSVTRSSAGVFVASFTTAMASASYCISTSSGQQSGVTIAVMCASAANSASSFELYVSNHTGAQVDGTIVNASIFSA